MATGRKKNKAPEGYCQLCWNQRVAALIDKPTCPHGKFVKDGKFDWIAYGAQIAYD